MTGTEVFLWSRSLGELALEVQISVLGVAGYLYTGI